MHQILAMCIVLQSGNKTSIHSNQIHIGANFVVV
jgi:hypothetical protein